jgi:hypothetical protein
LGVEAWLRRPARDTPADKDTDAHGWIGTGDGPDPHRYLRVRERLSDRRRTDRLYELRLFNRAVEAYLASMPAVSMFDLRNGMTEVGVEATAKFLILRPCSTPGACS